MQKFLKILVSNRFIILSVLGVTLYLVVSSLHISLWYVLIAGVILGVVFGKVFCRWVCPLGLIMELIMSISSDGKFRQMYQYHKLGCPIAWVSGWLNRYSLFTIEHKADSCKTVVSAIPNATL
jgi:polyferredoxin